MNPAAIVNIEEGNTKKESRNQILPIQPSPKKRRENERTERRRWRRKRRREQFVRWIRSLVVGIGSAAQIMWGVRCIRRGYAGDMRLMPLKAFGIASLFVGAIATTSVAFLSATGIHTVQDAIEMGANIRTNLGITPQIPEKQITEADDTS